MSCENKLPLIGEKAPSFKAETTQGPITFPDDFKGKWVVFFRTPPTSRRCARPNS